MGTLTSLTFDKASYTPGETVTATVTGEGLDETATVTGTLSGGGTISGTLTVDLLAMSDTGSRQWAQQSNDGTTAVFTATA